MKKLLLISIFLLVVVASGSLFFTKTDDIGKDNTTAGSIILSVEDMQRLYEWSEVGTLIFIHN